MVMLVIAVQLLVLRHLQLRVVLDRCSCNTECSLPKLGPHYWHSIFNSVNGM